MIWLNVIAVAEVLLICPGLFILAAWMRGWDQ